MITWQTKTIILRYHNVYDQQTWQDSGLPWGTPARRVIWTLITRSCKITRQTYISSNTVPMGTKLDRVVTYLKRFLTKKSTDSCVAWSCEITWQFNIIFSPGEVLGLKVTWLFDHVLMQNHVTNQTHYLHYHSAYGHQI